MRLVLLASSLVLFSVASLQAHEDPSGDTDPVVRVENGNFAVYFHNNTMGDDNSHIISRVIYSPEGKLLAPRHRASPEEAADYDQRLDDRTAVSGKSTYLVPEFSREYGRPYYTVSFDGRRERHKIPWPDGTNIDYVSGMTVFGDVLWLSGCPDNKQDFFLYRYVLGSLESPKSRDLGAVACIYDFPVASNLCTVGNSCCVVWCRYQKDHYDLVLSQWDGVSDHTQDAVLASKVDFNLSISIASIGNRLCVAYHHSRDGDYPGKAVIATIFRPLN